MATRLLARGIVLLGVGGVCAAMACPAQNPSEKWESEIQAFEKADQKRTPPQGAVLFLGSSSIRLWKTLAKDFPKAPTINRGFGGSEIADSTYFADRILFPYRPRAVVFYAGDNDIANGKTAERVAADFQTFATKLRERLPRTTLLYLAIKPSPSRWKHIETVREANQRIRTFIGTQTRMAFVDVFTPMLGADGKPRPELFVSDELHLNAKGYALWRTILAPHLR